jgi:hypothetical protein
VDKIVDMATALMKTVCSLVKNKAVEHQEELLEVGQQVKSAVQEGQGPKQILSSIPWKVLAAIGIAVFTVLAVVYKAMVWASPFITFIMLIFASFESVRYVAMKQRAMDLLHFFEELQSKRRVSVGTSEVYANTEHVLKDHRNTEGDANEFCRGMLSFWVIALLWLALTSIPGVSILAMWTPVVLVTALLGGQQVVAFIITSLTGIGTCCCGKDGICQKYCCRSCGRKGDVQDEIVSTPKSPKNPKTEPSSSTSSQKKEVGGNGAQSQLTEALIKHEDEEGTTDL